PWAAVHELAPDLPRRPAGTLRLRDSGGHVVAEVDLELGRAAALVALDDHLAATALQGHASRPVLELSTPVAQARQRTVSTAGTLCPVSSARCSHSACAVVRSRSASRCRCTSGFATWAPKFLARW